MSLSGSDQHLARLERMRGPAMIEAVRHALESGAQGIATTASESIIDGAISGAGHIASDPGEPPNADTHNLDQSIRVIEAADGVESGAIAVRVSAGGDEAPYAAVQELGSSTVHERPYMRPAALQNRPAIAEGVRIAMSEVIRG